MPGFEKSILTDVGWDALTDAEAGQHIEYTHLEAGDGFVYGGDAEIFAMTNLVSKKMDFPITNFSNDGAGQITLIGVISSKNVATGFNFREIGVRCTIDGGPSILYAVSNAGDEADYIPSSAESSVVIQTVQIIIRIDRAENLTVIIQPGLDVTAQNIGAPTVGPGWFRDKIGQILWFKRLNSPRKTITITETADVVSLDLPDITENLDMYVALGNPDIFPDFSTIQKALDYLAPRRINHQIDVNINVSAGVWLNSAPITVNHPEAQSIKIIGQISPAKAVTSAVSEGTNKVRLNAAVGTFTGMVAGDYVYYKGVATTSAAVSGLWLVTSVAADGSNCKYTSTMWSTWPLTTATGGTAYHIKTVIDFVGDGMRAKLGLGLLKNIVLRGHTCTGHWAGFLCTAGEAHCEWVGAYGWQSNGSSYPVGIVANTTGRIYLTDCSACNNYTGISSGNQGSFMSAKNTFANGCYSIGVEGQGGDFLGDGIMACGNRSIGIVNTDVGSMSLNNCQANWNAAYGLYCQFNSNVGLGPFGGGNFGGNATRDITLTYLASIIRTGTPATGYNTANIAPNTLSWDGCIFIP